MDSSEIQSTAPQPTSLEVTPSHPGPYELEVHNLTAKIFLNRPIQDLVPVRYLRMADRFSTVQRKAWIFRTGTEDARTVDLEEWSIIDIRYRGVFKTLAKVPCFDKGLWDGGSELCRVELDAKKPRAQAQVIYALMNEIGEMLGIKRSMSDGKGHFYLRPRLLSTPMEYWTGYREKHKDGPFAEGFLSLDFEGERYRSLPILPVSTTMEEESLLSCLQGKFKLMLGQLLLHVRPLQPPGDKLPDQEIFLLGLHGSKLHIMRAFFPGQKTSSLWCRREVPGPASTLPLTASSPPSPATPTPSSAHMEYFTPGSTPAGIPEGQDQEQEPHQEEAEDGQKREQERGRTRHRSNSTRFYAPQNVERLQAQLAHTTLSRLDNEPNLRTFRALATREYDLWQSADFAAAVQALVALHLYLLSGQARCGALMDTFRRHPFPNPGGATPTMHEEEEDEDDAETDAEADERVKHDLEMEVLRLSELEERFKREEMDRKREDEEAARLREAMRWSDGDRISSLQGSRQPWWDFVWRDREEEMAMLGRETESGIEMEMEIEEGLSGERDGPERGSDGDGQENDMDGDYFEHDGDLDADVGDE
ncbi:hypothetical protein N7474_010658 [Penicillium riverlandense]|uniref:uncharacterized protein n=1 Tax=Penicillium riverlandense TaxID=1903569 RepID=UPI0025481321|nr:uncharacterized protein N7474_010658 [Penicillium riverlandense]KAJ5807066.1 hypothetical protein N7474_010658 [Penicillium riverlandense]